MVHHAPVHQELLKATTNSLKRIALSGQPCFTPSMQSKSEIPSELLTAALSKYKNLTHLSAGLHMLLPAMRQRVK